MHGESSARPTPAGRRGELRAEDIGGTEVCVGFALDVDTAGSPPPQQHVFAFLPLRSYGLRFIVNADFIVPSSREAVDVNSAWNQWLREQLAPLVVRALGLLQRQPLPAGAVLPAGLATVSSSGSSSDAQAPGATSAASTGGVQDRSIGQEDHGINTTDSAHTSSVSESGADFARRIWWLNYWLRCLPLRSTAQDFFRPLPEAVGGLARAEAIIPTTSGACVSPLRVKLRVLRDPTLSALLAEGPLQVGVSPATLLCTDLI